MGSCYGGSSPGPEGPGPTSDAWPGPRPQVEVAGGDRVELADHARANVVPRGWIHFSSGATR